MGASVITKFRDYKDVGGVKQAHRIEQDSMMPFTIEYTEVRHNVDDIPEDAFEVPASLK
jgi:hypothetical protein